MSDKTKPKLSIQRVRFLETKGFFKTYKEYDNSEMLRELLFAQQLQLQTLEKIRSNTSKLVWWLVAIPIIIFAIALMGGVSLF